MTEQHTDVDRVSDELDEQDEAKAAVDADKAPRPFDPETGRPLDQVEPYVDPDHEYNPTQRLVDPSKGTDEEPNVTPPSAADLVATDETGRVPQAPDAEASELDMRDQVAEPDEDADGALDADDEESQQRAE